MSEPDPTAPPTEASRPGWAKILLSAFAPGALAGTQVAGLLFFLNPHLPFATLPVLQSIGFYGLLLGIASLVLIVPFTRGRPDLALRWLPLHLTLVLAAAGLSAWIHASYFAFFLPPGINRRLLKAAILLSLAALICFYTVLLHRLRSPMKRWQRPYSRRSWLIFGLMALASIYVVVERREAFRPQLKRIPRETTFEGSTRPLLGVIGIESATLDAILPLEEQGRLPFFSRLLREGFHARLAPLTPPRRSALWATLATGKYPYQHGVVAELSYRANLLGLDESFKLLPLGIGFEHWGSRRPGPAVDSGALMVRPLWEIFSRLGVPTILVGWPLSSPPPEGVRTALSERFFESGDATEVFPVELAERARLFSTGREDIDPAAASRFGPEPPLTVLEALARDLWIRDLGSFLLDQDPQVAAFFLALPGLARVSHSYFGGYEAVQFKGVQDPESVEAAQLIAAYYVHLDDLLSQIWESIPEPRLLVVVSTHGAQGPRGRREVWRRLRRQPALSGYTDGGSDGVLMMLGEGIESSATLRSADLVDLVPTLLYGLGFPSARDFDGAVLTPAFERSFLARQPLTFVPSYETLARPLP